jgi:rhodanese-related sulfurtransferase
MRVPRAALLSSVAVFLNAAGAAAQENGSAPARGSGSAPADVFHATVAEPPARTAQVSTAELLQILAEGRAILLDTRPRMEWALGHIPGAVNAAPRAGVPAHLYTPDVTDVEQLAGDRTRPLILYCNGPFCGKSHRLADELLATGFSAVRRYQLGAPVWRALGGVMVMEEEGVRHVFDNDRTAVWIDARDPDRFRTSSIPGARNVPRSALYQGGGESELTAARSDGRLPFEDHNTRIIVFGSDAAQARAVAEAIAAIAFHNVSYFERGVEALLAALR